MAEITRTSQAEWTGDLRSGKGQIVTESGVLDGAPYSYSTRFEEQPGTNPEELIAAAHAACYSMAFAGLLKREGYQPDWVSTRAVCVMEPQEEGGYKITRMQLDVLGKIPNMDEGTFRRMAQSVQCPVSNLLKDCLTIKIEAGLLEHAYTTP